MPSFLQLLEKENEENAIVCLKIIIDMHKNYRSYTGPDNQVLSLSTQVEPFLDIVITLFKNIPEAKERAFDMPPQPVVAPKPLVPSLKSFKVLLPNDSPPKHFFYKKKKKKKYRS